MGFTKHEDVCWFFFIFLFLKFFFPVIPGGYLASIMGKTEKKTIAGCFVLKNGTYAKKIILFNEMQAKSSKD